MPEEIFPAVAQPAMDRRHRGPGSQPVTATIDNRTGMPDGQVREVIEDRWVELAGLQFAQPSTFQLYSNYQSSMLARTPFKTPSNVIEEIKLARAVADTDDDVAATIGEMLAVAFGEGIQNHHRDETTLSFFNQMMEPTALDVESVLEELYREFLIAGSVTHLEIYTRKRMKYFPLKSDEAVEAQLQVPNVGILPAEQLRVITNDLLNTGELAYYVQDWTMKNWLDEYFNPNTKGQRRAIMAMEEPILAVMFTGRKLISMRDGDPNSRGKWVYTLNQSMIHRTSLPKGSQPYARPLLTRNFALLEAKRLLNIMDYALLQGGTNYIVVAKKGTDQMPAQQPEIENLVNQVTHASRSGVMVGDHRLELEIITPNLEELLNPAKRKLIGRKIAMGLLRQSEQVTGDSGGKGGENEMELMARVISADRNKILRHAQSSFYNNTATRNRSTFKMGAPTIWAAKIILTDAKDFWNMVVQARDRGDIPRRWLVETLGFNYDAGLAEREREMKRGDDRILEPASTPFSNNGEPQDNGPGRPRGTSSNNGKGKDSPGQGKDKFAPKKTVQKNAGETVKAMVDNNEVYYIGETTAALLEGAAEEVEYGCYVTTPMREAILGGEPVRVGQSVIVPVNLAADCTEYTACRIGNGLRVVVGRRLGDDAMVAKALCFTEPHYDLKLANDYAIRWGFIAEPLVERAALECAACGEMGWSAEATICEACGFDNGSRPGLPAGGSAAGNGDADVA